MSNNFSTSFGAVPSRSATPAKPSLWRRLFNAWLASFANRLDPDGNVIL